MIIRVDVLSVAFLDAQNCGHQKIDLGIMTHPQTVKVYGGTENVPKKRNG